MSTDAKKHASIAAGEKPTRLGLANAIFSINDLVNVANATEAGQVATAVAAGGQTLASDPVLVTRLDARGLHRAEYSYDGSVWLPFSGLLSFANDSARDTWTTSNSALLSVLDRCISNSIEYFWSGSAWLPRDWIAFTTTLTNIALGNGTLAAFYRMNGLKSTEFEIEFTFGSTSSSSGNWTFSPPTTPAASINMIVGTGLFRDASTGDLYPIDTLIAGGSIISRIADASGTYAKSTAQTNTLPVVPATGDTLYLTGFFRNT